MLGGGRVRCIRCVEIGVRGTCYAGLKVEHIAKNLDISLSDVNGCLNILLHIENHQVCLVQATLAHSVPKDFKDAVCLLRSSG